VIKVQNKNVTFITVKSLKSKYKELCEKYIKYNKEAFRMKENKFCDKYLMYWLQYFLFWYII
ncbi:MAG: hypothetical protein RSG48_04840, partial [Clostridia bacterium]